MCSVGHEVGGPIEQVGENRHGRGHKGKGVCFGCSVTSHENAVTEVMFEKLFADKLVLHHFFGRTSTICRLLTRSSNLAVSSTKLSPASMERTTLRYSSSPNCWVLHVLEKTVILSIAEPPRAVGWFHSK
jgi:hypothetical protein